MTRPPQQHADPITPAVLLVPDDLGAPRLARAWLTDHVADLPPDVVSDAVLLTSELVTNAVLHGQPEVHVAVQLTPPTLRVAVADRGPTMPVLADQSFNPLQRSGRGLFLVTAMAATWGVDRHREPPGKTIWFTLNIG